MAISCENLHTGSRCKTSNKTKLLHDVIQLHDYHPGGNRIEKIISERL